MVVLAAAVTAFHFLLCTPFFFLFHFPSSFGLSFAQRQPEEGRRGKERAASRGFFSRNMELYSLMMEAAFLFKPNTLQYIYGRLRLIIEDFVGVNFRSDIMILNKNNF